jgi:hypothetical protein
LYQPFNIFDTGFNGSMTETSPCDWRSGVLVEVRITGLLDMTLKTEVPCHSRCWCVKELNIGLNFHPAMA